jgi:hypothetical protein
MPFQPVLPVQAGLSFFNQGYCLFPDFFTGFPIEKLPGLHYEKKIGLYLSFFKPNNNAL